MHLIVYIFCVTRAALTCVYVVQGEYLEEQLEQCEGEEEEEKKAELLSRRATLHRKMGR